MAYMIYQQYANAIREGYAGRPEVADLAVEAKTFRAWLERLTIDPRIRAGLVEQAKVIEETFADLTRQLPRGEGLVPPHQPDDERPL